jgi:hypothetical protein
VLTVAKVLARLGLIPNDERFSVPPLIRLFASAPNDRLAVISTTSAL